MELGLGTARFQTKLSLILKIINYINKLTIDQPQHRTLDLTTLQNPSFRQRYNLPISDDNMIKQPNID